MRDCRKMVCSGSILIVQGEITTCLHLDGTIAGPLPLRSAGDSSGRTGFYNSSGHRLTAHMLYLVKDKFFLACTKVTFTVTKFFN